MVQIVQTASLGALELQELYVKREVFVRGKFKRNLVNAQYKFSLFLVLVRRCSCLRFNQSSSLAYNNNNNHFISLFLLISYMYFTINRKRKGYWRPVITIGLKMPDRQLHSQLAKYGR